MPIEMTIAGLLIDTTNDQPILLLKDGSGKRAIPIVIGLSEAGAIASELESIEFPRPMTHDLLRCLVEQLGGEMLRVVINDLRDNTFYATIVLKQGRDLVHIDARPSDAIALAVRTAAPIYVEEKVVLAVLGPPEDTAEAMTAEEDVEAPQPVDWSHLKDDPEKLKAVLEGLSTDDFGKYKQ